MSLHCPYIWVCMYIHAYICPHMCMSVHCMFFYSFLCFLIHILADPIANTQLLYTNVDTAHACKVPARTRVHEDVCYHIIHITLTPIAVLI
jgi:hypothetical protein